MLTILWYILIGAVTGAIARLVVPGRNPIGIVLTVLIGIAGAILGGVIAASLGAGTFVAFVFAVIIAALAVALLSSINRGDGGGRRRGSRSRGRTR